jgi:hypothetical protein
VSEASAARRRLPALVLDELAGCAWTLENRGKHWHLRINGRLVAVVPRGRLPDSARGRIKLRGDIRRHLKRMRPITAAEGG